MFVGFWLILLAKALHFRCPFDCPRQNRSLAGSLQMRGGLSCTSISPFLWLYFTKVRNRGEYITNASIKIELRNCYGARPSSMINFPFQDSLQKVVHRQIQHALQCGCVWFRPAVFCTVSNVNGQKC